MKLSNYPTLEKAFFLMLADNTGSAKIIRDVKARVASTEYQFPVDPGPVEIELSRLTEDELDEVCTGDQDEATEISPEAAQLLTFMFEELF